MKSSAKLSILGIFLFPLILTTFLAINPAAAPSPSLEKISLGDNIIRIQSASPAGPVLDIQLIENTDQCLVNCHAILKFHPYQDITLPDSPNSEFRWDFIKAKPGMLGLRSHSFNILKTISYSVTINEYGEVTHYYETNSTIPDGCWDYNKTHYACNVTEVIDSRKETRYKQEYQPFNFWGETLEAGKDYYIKLEGKKYAQLGPNNVDWIPTIKGFEISEWDWWNSSWIYRQPINLSVTSGSTEQDYQVKVIINTSNNGTHWNWTNECVNSNSTRARFTNSTPGTNALKLDFWVESCSISGQNMTVWIEVAENITTTNQTLAYMYYGNANVSTTSENIIDYDINFALTPAGTATASSEYSDVYNKTKAIDGVANSVIDTTWLANPLSGGWFNVSFSQTRRVLAINIISAYSSVNIWDGFRNTSYDLDGSISYFEFPDTPDNLTVYNHSISPTVTNSLNLTPITIWEQASGLGGLVEVYVYGFKYQIPEPTYSIGAEEEYDTTAPSFSNHKIYPDPAPNEDQDVQVNVIINESNIDTVFLEWNNGTAVNYTVTTSDGSEYYYTIASGNYTAHDNITYRWYANDTFENDNWSAQQSFTVANRLPSTPSLANPENNSGVALGYPVPEFNWSATDDDAEDQDNLIYTFEIYYFNGTPYNQTTISNNYTTQTLPTAEDEVYQWRVMANDSYNVSGWSDNWTFQYANWSIQFNLTDSYTGEQIDTSLGSSHFDISCDNGFSVANVENPYNATDAFAPGIWECIFSDLVGYFDETQNITTDNDTTIEVPMSEAKQMTIEEHTWLEWLYDCWHSGTCKDLLEAINLTTTEISETVENIWDQYKRTNQSVVTTENIINKTVDATSNLTINYTIDVPIKEGYTFGETSGEVRLDYLPIRISYWFLDDSDNKTCYSQGNYSVATAEPYCQPLTVYTVGQINSTIDFTVDLRPSLPSGNYTIVRNIEIDPEQVWINYGQEVIGVLEVKEGNTEPMVSIKNTGTFPGFESAGIAGAIGTVTGWSIGNAGGIVAVISVIAVLGIAGYFLFTKKRNQYQGYSYKPF